MGTPTHRPGLRQFDLWHLEQCARGQLAKYFQKLTARFASCNWHHHEAALGPAKLTRGSPRVALARRDLRWTSRRSSIIVNCRQVADGDIANAPFVSGVPSDVLSLTDNSPMTLTMGFSPEGPRTVWDIQEIWWYQDDRRDSAMGIWRRARPPSTAMLELRNRFDNIRAHRTPFDGTLSRESAETLAAASVLDVPVAFKLTK